MRIKISLFFNKVGKFLQESPIFFLKPSQLRKIGKKSYNTPSSINLWTGEDFINLGLFPAEKELLELLPGKQGNLLLLGIGGGREALVLGKAGFKITGVDFIKELVEKAVEYGRKSGIEINGVVEEITDIEFAPERFDVIWYSCSIYSSIPGRKNRINSLVRSGKMLLPDGYIACFFYWNPNVRSGKIRWKIGKFISILTFGNLGYERGDIFKDNLEFLHAFSDTDALKSEFNKSGFEVVKFIFPENSNNACALLKKKV